MTKFDFRVADLIDRVDWTDPDFPGFVRMLERISHPVTYDNGRETILMHVISINGSRSIKPRQITMDDVES